MPDNTFLPQEVINELIDSIWQGEIICDELSADPTRRLDEILVDRPDSLKVYIHTKENGHNIPHFHVSYKDSTGTYAIEDCSELDYSGKKFQNYLKNLKRWHNKNKVLLKKNGMNPGQRTD